MKRISIIFMAFSMICLIGCGLKQENLNGSQKTPFVWLQTEITTTYETIEDEEVVSTTESNSRYEWEYYKDSNNYKYNFYRNDTLTSSYEHNDSGYEQTFFNKDGEITSIEQYEITYFDEVHLMKQVVNITKNKSGEITGSSTGEYILEEISNTREYTEYKYYINLLDSSYNSSYNIFKVKNGKIIEYSIVYNSYVGTKYYYNNKEQIIKSEGYSSDGTLISTTLWEDTGIHFLNRDEFYNTKSYNQNGDLTKYSHPYTLIYEKASEAKVKGESSSTSFIQQNGNQIERVTKFTQFYTYKKFKYPF